jgi:hypothetical protein
MAEDFVAPELYYAQLARVGRVQSALHAVPCDEGRGVVFVDPKDLPSVASPRLANRICHALTARETGDMIETVNGQGR